MKRPPLARILRHLLDALAAVLLLASIGLVVLWARSYSEPEHFWACYRSGRIDSLKTNRGDFTFARRHTPYRLRSAEVYHESGPRVLPRLVSGSYPVERRWGPVVYAAAAPAPPPTEEQAARARELFRVAQAFDAAPWPSDPQESRDWTDRRARAYREAFSAERRLKAARTSVWLVTVPAWLLLLPLIALPAVRAMPAWRRWQAWQAALPRPCPDCGSDIAAGDDRCPACARTKPVPKERVQATRVPATVSAAREVVDTAPQRLPSNDFDLPRRVPYHPRPRLRTRPPPRRPRPTP